MPAVPEQLPATFLDQQLPTRDLNFGEHVSRNFWNPPDHVRYESTLGIWLPEDDEPGVAARIWHGRVSDVEQDEQTDSRLFMNVHDIQKDLGNVATFLGVKYNSRIQEDGSHWQYFTFPNARQVNRRVEQLEAELANSLSDYLPGVAESYSKLAKAKEIATPQLSNIDIVRSVKQGYFALAGGRFAWQERDPETAESPAHTIADRAATRLPYIVLGGPHLWEQAGKAAADTLAERHIFPPERRELPNVDERARSYETIFFELGIGQTIHEETPLSAENLESALLSHGQTSEQHVEDAQIVHNEIIFVGEAVRLAVNDILARERRERS